MAKHNQPNPGAFVLIGGAEDKRGEKRVLSQVVGLTPAPSVAVVTSATGYAEEVFDSYRRAFLDLGATQIEHVDVRRRKEAATPQYSLMIDAADLIFFVGGDQEKLVKLLSKTALLRRIKKRHLGGAIIAGSSAGATALGNPMVIGGDGNSGFQKGSVTIHDGFGFLGRIVVDTHFMARCRIPRLAQTLSASGSELGIGVCEDTGVVVWPDRTCRVIGSGMVSFLSCKTRPYSNYATAGCEENVAVDGIRFSFLTHGMRYDLDRGQMVKTSHPQGP